MVSGRGAVIALILGVISVFIVVRIFRNGVEFGDWLHAKTHADGPAGADGVE